MSFENDEKLIKLESKLLKFETKMEEVRKLYFSGEAKSVSNLMEKINKAINKTKSLIEQRKKEIIKENEEKLMNSIYKIGDYVYGKHLQIWFVSVIEKVIERPKVCDYEYGVKFVGIQEFGLLSPVNKNVKPYSHPMKFLRPGVMIEAVYEKDEKFYPAKIESLDDYGYCWVKFKGYTGIQKTKVELIRFVGKYGDEIYGVSEESKKRSRETDEVEKNRKKKKRKKKEDQGAKIFEKKKQNWLNFVEKSKEQKLPGIGNIVKKRKKDDLGGRREKRDKNSVISKNSKLAKNTLEEFKHLRSFGDGDGEDKNYRRKKYSRSRRYY